MIFQPFSLKFATGDLSLKGGYLKCVSKIFTENLLERREHELHLICKENSDIKDIEKAILEAIKLKKTSAHLRLRLNKWTRLLLLILVSISIVVLIDLLSIHSSLTFDLFSGNTSPNILNIKSIHIYIALSAFILGFLAFSPRIILGDFDNLIDWAKTRFSTNEYVKRGLSRKMRLLLRINKELSTITIWNPLIQGHDSWIITQLVPVLLDANKAIHIQIKHDEKNVMLQKLGELGLNKHQHDDTSENSSLPGLQPFPVNLLANWEHEFLIYLIFSSSYNLPEEWKKNSQGHNIVSRNLAGQIFDFYGDRVFGLNNQKVTFEKFLERCLNDYGFLVLEETFNKQNISLSPDLPEILFSKLRFEDLQDAVITDLNKLSDELHDPLAYLILLGILKNESLINPRVIKLLEAFIHQIKLTESYHLMSDYWPRITKNEPIADGGYQQSIMQFFDVKTLNELAVCLANSGMYEEALEVYDILGNIYPAKASIAIADILDSQGEYTKALKKLFEVDKEWVQTEIIDDDTLILELFLNIAWVIVSGRLVPQKVTGLNYLQTTDAILNKLPDNENYINYRTRYYNTLANYNEWDKQYKEALSNYERALKLPGNLLRKSSLLVNHGIANRLLGNSLLKKGDKIEHYLKSRSNIKQGVQMKGSIGEKNQLPGSYHNLAETLLELSQLVDDEKESREILHEAFEISSRGIDMLIGLNSTKRKGRLIAESLIASTLLSQRGELFDLEDPRKELLEWIKTEEKQSFDYLEVRKLLDRFNIDLIPEL